MSPRPKRVGLLVGRERSFPEALITEVTRRKAGVEIGYAQIEATRADQPLPYDVLVDRISHDIPCYQPVLKVAALNGTRVINNPFWRIADDKFFNVALALKLGVKVPRTLVLPSKVYPEDVTEQSLTNLQLVDWDRILAELGLPLYSKPHWGGGWRDVTRVESREALFRVYDRSGQKTLILQEEIRWTQYVRCLVVGQEAVRPALWDPRRTHFERYTHAAEAMPALSDALTERIIRDARTLCRALGYDMNTVEFAVRDGEPYAIDFMNSAPDLDLSSLGQGHFDWVVTKMADLIIRAATHPPERPVHRWDALLGKASERAS